MKKILALVLAAITLLSLSACLEESAPKKETYVEEEADTNQAEKEEIKEETFSLNETAVFENLKITALEIKESNGESFFTPESGKIFVGVKFEVENISAEEQSVSSLLLFDAYVGDVKCDLSFTASSAFDDGTLDGDIAAGKKLIGWYAVEIPADWSVLELNVKSDWLSSNAAKFVFNK